MTTRDQERRMKMAERLEKTPGPRWIKTNQLLDMNGEILAQFQIMEDDSHQFIICIPFFGMFWLYTKQANNYIIRHPAEKMLPEHYLGYLATIARYTENAQLAYEMRLVGTSDYVSVKLVNGMMASSIAALTGFTVEFVREFYKDYFVVDNATP